MAKTMLIADDLTGALDAGVCLLSADVLVAVSPEKIDSTAIAQAPSVLSINADTRHLDARHAYGRVHALVRMARAAGVELLFKKTDSALRGNIGAELAAFLDASGASRLHFIPALPEMGRTTVDGVHLIGGVPVSESTFGADPFNPVTFDRVSQIIRAQTDLPVTLVSEGQPVPVDGRGIVVYDATTPASVSRRVSELMERGEGGLLAGCSGAAQAVAQALDLSSPVLEGGSTKGNLLVACGSINRVSADQCTYAAAQGASVLHVGRDAKCEVSWGEGPEGTAFVERAVDSWAHHSLTILDGSDLEDLSGIIPEASDVRQVVSDNFGGLLVRVCRRRVCGRVLVTGGDVLASFLRAAGVDAVRPLGQIVPGVVGFEMEWGARSLVIASKSGGFGSQSLFVDMAAAAAPTGGVMI